MSVRALAPFPGAWPSRIRRLQYVAKAGERGMHECLVGGSGSMSPRKILKFRPCESVSEAVGENTTKHTP